MITEAFRIHIFRFFDSESDSKSDSEFDSESDSEFDLKSDLEQKYGKSTGELVKARKQNFNELNALIAVNDRIIDRNLFERYFGYEV